jgi:hypothetical protein
MMQLHMLPVEMISRICGFFKGDRDPVDYQHLFKDETADLRSLRSTCKVCAAVGIMLFRKLCYVDS